MFGHKLDARTKSRDAFVLFLLCVGGQIIWKRRGLAALRALPQKWMFPVLRKMRSRLFDHLGAELAALWEEQFLQRWSTPFIRVW